MKYLFILNDPPYGTERSYNALRLARMVMKKEGNEARAFLLGDAAACAKGGQKVPEGYYNVEFLLQTLIRRDCEIGVCGTCMDARGIQDTELTDGALRGSLEELAEWTEWADKVLVF